MKIQISDHFNYNKLLKFTIPSIITMMFYQTYNVLDDGFFISNFVGKDAFVALNLMSPALMMMNTIGYMLATGGNALVSTVLGEGKKEKANQYFTLITIYTIIISAIITIFGLVILEPACIAVGAEGAVLENCLIYGRLICPFTVVFQLQEVFQNFLITAGKPKMSMFITVASGITNITFDILLIVIFKLGIVGSVLATVSGPILGTIIPALYFLFGEDRTIKFSKTSLDFSILLRACSNGTSELVTDLSLGLMSMLYNYQLLRIGGNDAVAAYGAVMYINYIFISAFIGYSMGVAPIIGFNYGAENEKELKNIFHKSLVIVSITGIILFAISEFASVPFSKIFVGSDEKLLEMTIHGNRLYSIMYLFAGINIFATSFFTALNNGFVSSALALIRTIVFKVGALFLLPLFFGLDGIWASAFVADILMLIVTIVVFYKFKAKYNY